MKNSTTEFLAMQIAKIFIEERKNKNITQKTLADQAYISVITVKRLELYHQLPNVNSFIAMVKALNLDLIITDNNGNVLIKI